MRRPGSSAMRSTCADASRSTASRAAESELLLRLQFRVVLLDERTDLAGHVQQLRPLFLIERDREASESIDRHATLLADFQAHRASALVLELFVLSLEPLQLRFQIFCF